MAAQETVTGCSCAVLCECDQAIGWKHGTPCRSQCTTTHLQCYVVRPCVQVALPLSWTHHRADVDVLETQVNRPTDTGRKASRVVSDICDDWIHRDAFVIGNHPLCDNVPAVVRGVPGAFWQLPVVVEEGCELDAAQFQHNRAQHGTA